MRGAAMASRPLTLSLSLSPSSFSLSLSLSLSLSAYASPSNMSFFLWPWPLAASLHPKKGGASKRGRFQGMRKSKEAIGIHKEIERGGRSRERERREREEREERERRERERGERERERGLSCSFFSLSPALPGEIARGKKGRKSQRRGGRGMGGEGRGGGRGKELYYLSISGQAATHQSLT